MEIKDTSDYFTIGKAHCLVDDSRV